DQEAGLVGSGHGMKKSLWLRSGNQKLWKRGELRRRIGTCTADVHPSPKIPNRSTPSGFFLADRQPLRSAHPQAPHLDTRASRGPSLRRDARLVELLGGHLHRAHTTLGVS